MELNLDEIEKALAEATQGRIGTQFVDQWHDQPQGVQLLFIDGIQRNVIGAVVSPQDAHLIAHVPEWLRLLVELVRKLEKVAEAAGGVASSVLVAKEHSKHRQMAEYISCMNEATGPEMDALIKALIVANVPGWEE